MARKLVQTQLIEVVIPKGSTNGKFQLPDEPNLRDVHLHGVELFVSETVPKSILSENNTIPQTLAKSIFLTLQSYRGKNFMWQRPIVTFLNLSTGSNLFTYFASVFAGQRFNCPKSYIEIADISLISAVEDQSLLLEFSYSEIAAVAKKDKQGTFANKS